MKRCRKCGRRYEDESLNFCLDDGSPLSAGADSDQTLISPVVPARAVPTSPAVTLTQSSVSQSSSRGVLLAAIILLAVIAGGGAVALLYRINNWDSREKTNTPGTRPESPEPSPVKSKQDQPDPLKPSTIPNLSGSWSMVTTIERTSYPQYANLALGYQLTISQSGTEFTGEGRKMFENGREMDPAEQTPIHINGSIDRNRVSATFVEEGLRRNTSGKFEWTLTRDGNQLRGTFNSTAARSSGSSIATRQP